MPLSYNSIAINQVFANESPMVFIIGSTPIFNFNYLGSGTLTTPVNALYRGKEDVSSTQLTGSTTVTGRVVTTKQCSLTVAGEYELYVTVTDGSVVRVKAIRILVRKLGVF